MFLDRQACSMDGLETLEKFMEMCLTIHKVMGEYASKTATFDFLDVLLMAKCICNHKIKVLTSWSCQGRGEPGVRVKGTWKVGISEPLLLPTPTSHKHKHCHYLIVSYLL